jgi:putative ABC transport system permease protein
MTGSRDLRRIVWRPVFGQRSGQFFSGLQPEIALGRGFRLEDHNPDAEPVAVLSYRYWRERFNGDPDVLGTAVEIERNPVWPYQGKDFMHPAEPEQDSATFRVVGVMGETFRGFPLPGGDVFRPAAWVPIEPAYTLFVGVPETLPTSGSLAAYVRRAPGATAKAVATEVRARYGAPDAFRNSVPGARLDAIDGIVSSISAERDAKRQLTLFLTGSLLLSLVAAANVSLFLLARAPGRRRELGIRMAVGAVTRRLARQLSTEAGLLVAVSAVLGLIVSVWLSLFLRGLAFMRDADWTHVTLLDWRVLSVTSAFLLALTALVSMVPIVGIKRLGIGASSRRVTGRASLAQRVAGTAQIAIAATLGAAAIAFGWYLGLLTFGYPGYEIENRYVARFTRFAYGSRNIDDVAERTAVEHASRHDAIEAIPGVVAIGYGAPIPGDDGNWIPTRLADPASPGATFDVDFGSIEAEYIDVLGLRLLTYSGLGEVLRQSSRRS